MLYLIRPIGELSLFESGLAEIFRTNPDTGRPEKVTDFKGSVFPGMTCDLKLDWDSRTRSFEIELTDEELQEIVEAMSLSDPKTGDRIVKADRRNENDPFFRHTEMRLEIPGDGIRLDTNTAEGKWWLAAAKSNSRRFDIDNTTENKLIAREQEFSLTTTEKDVEKATMETKESIKATMILHSLKDKQLREVCRAFEISIGSDPDREMLIEALFSKITREKDFKSRSGERNIEFFLNMTDLPAEELELRAKIQEGIEMNIVKKTGKLIFFNEVPLGATVEASAQFLTKKENTEIKADLLGIMKEEKVNVKPRKKQPDIVPEDDFGSTF